MQRWWKFRIETDYNHSIETDYNHHIIDPNFKGLSLIIQDVPKEEDESITPLFIGRF
jgi:hypothetical protein